MLSFEKLLIERVQRVDLLYNTRSKLYKNSQKRDTTWINISRQLGVEVEQCKQRWKSLRDRFVREHRKVQSGEAEPDCELWEHYNQLLFLKDYLQPRKYTYLQTFGRTTPQHAVEVKVEETEGTQPQTDDSLSKADDTEFKTNEAFLSPEPEYSDGGNFSLEEVSNSNGTPSKKFKSDVEDAFVDFIGGMSRMVDKKQNAQPPEETENTLFMKMIAKKMDLLPLTSQGSLQIEILTLVNNEMRKYVSDN